jgi:Restriction endonuclease
MTIRSGKSYEFQVMRHLLEQRQHIAFALDARVPDTTGQYERQIDVWLPDTREIVECKHHAERVDVGIVDTLVGATQDVGATASQIFSSSGFTQMAMLRADKAGITCTTLPYASKFATPYPPTGNGYYAGEYIELCQCATPIDSTGNMWGRISYFTDDEAWSLCTALSVEWGEVKAHRFIAYLLMAHTLSCPPADKAINAFIEDYGSRFEIGQEWSISEDEVRCLAFAETA